MQAGPPDQDPVPPPASLAARMGDAWKQATATAAEGPRWLPYAVAGLIAAGPLLTIGGAGLLAARERDAATAIEQAMAPRVAARAAAAQARGVLSPVLPLGSLAETLDALARVLPADATLVRAERLRDGALELDISTPDPDALRAALRRAPAFGRIRALGQRQGDGAMLASFRLDYP